MKVAKYEQFIKISEENEIPKSVATAATTNLQQLEVENVEDISFKFKSKKQQNIEGVISHEIITIEAFSIEGKNDIKFQEYHLIFGTDSKSIFDVFSVDEVAGLKINDCIKHLDKLKMSGQSEMMDGAFIAGLCNFVGEKLFCFFNVSRMSLPGYANRIIPHESLHMARNLITLEANEFVRTNLGKDGWWEDERAKFSIMDDTNEEYFAEVLERCSAIAYDRWQKIIGENKRLDTTPAPLSDREYKTFSGKN